MTRLLRWFITSVNSSLNGFVVSIASFKPASIQHDVHSLSYVPHWNKWYSMAWSPCVAITARPQRSQSDPIETCPQLHPLIHVRSSGGRQSTNPRATWGDFSPSYWPDEQFARCAGTSLATWTILSLVNLDIRTTEGCFNFLKFRSTLRKPSNFRRVISTRTQAHMQTMQLIKGEGKGIFLC